MAEVKNLIVEGDTRLIGDTNAGKVTATSLVKSGGTASQFLKADGSVDSNSYITISSVPTAGTTTQPVSTTGSGGSATTWSKSDHVHSISLATGDNNGQVKIAGTNVSVKGLGTAAYTNTTDSYSSTGSAPTTGKAVAAALGTLDVTGASNIAASKTIKSWSETDGKVNITTQDIAIASTQVSGLGTASEKDFTTSVTNGSNNLVTSGAVYSALAALPEPMVFKGSVGTNGTIEWSALPTPADHEGETYKVITNHNTAPICKVGDTIISDGENWVVIPSGDEPSGTVTSIATGSGLTGGTITTTGTISHADTSTQSSISASGRRYITGVTLDGFGHVTGLTTGTETVVNTNTAQLQVSDTANKKINTAESTGKYIQFEDGTNEFGVYDGTSRFKVGVTPSISNNVTYSGTLSDGKVAIFDGATGKIKNSGFTIAKSVPSNAVFTDNNTWRPIKVNSMAAISDSSTTVNFAGDGATEVSYDNGTITINSNDTTYGNATQSVAGLMSSTDKTKLDGIATGATNVTSSTVSGWGFTKNAGTVTQVKVGTTAYNPTSGIISLPAYPTSTNTWRPVKVNDETVLSDTTTAVNFTGSGATEVSYENGAVVISSNDTNTHRPIQMNGTQILGNNTTALNLKAGSNVSLTNSSGTVTIAATDTTYQSKAAASGGTDVSLVTTGEKYTWNNKGTYSKPSGGIPASDLASGVIPTVNNATLTIQKNGTTVKTFTANAASNVTCNITVPTTAADVGAATSGHTHTASIAADSGTSSISLAANTKYKLTAGGSSVIFTTPADNNTTYAFAGGTNKFTVTPSGGSAQTVTVTPSIANNITGDPNADWSANHVAVFNDDGEFVIKGSGKTLGTSVPANAVFTDYRCISEGHFTPSGGSAGSTTAGSAVTWSGAVVTGLTLTKGHVTGITTGTIPANPNTWRPLGTTADTACAGNDSRLSNARTPTAHATTATTYGVGTSSNYGHVKLGAADQNGATAANGVCAPNGHTHSQYLTSHQDISGKVSGPASATANHIATFDGTTGKLIKDSGKTIVVEAGTGTNSVQQIGSGGTASGNYSHAEGKNTTASGDCSHAEGVMTIASGGGSHAEGYYTKAILYYSHAEGYSTTASGNYSHAEGDRTTAGGTSSHAEGDCTTAQNQAEHAQGRYNSSHSASTTFGNAGNTIHSIGIGRSESVRRNAVEVMQNGDVYVYGVGGYSGIYATNRRSLQSMIRHPYEDVEAELFTDLVGANISTSCNALRVYLSGFGQEELYLSKTYSDIENTEYTGSRLVGNLMHTYWVRTNSEGIIVHVKHVTAPVTLVEEAEHHGGGGEE